MPSPADVGFQPLQIPNSILQGKMNRQSPYAASLNAFMQQMGPGAQKAQQGMMQQKQINAITQALQAMRQQGQQPQPNPMGPQQMPAPSMSPSMQMGQGGGMMGGAAIMGGTAGGGMQMGQAQTQADKIRQLLGGGGGMYGTQNDPLGILG